MVFIWVEHEFEILVSSHEGGDQVQGVLHMNIVVGSAVNKHVFPFQVIGEVDGRIVLIAVRVFPWGAHESLCVNVVVILPVCDRGNSDANIKNLCTLCHAQR